MVHKHSSTQVTSKDWGLVLFWVLSLALIFCTRTAQAINPIHESAYDLIPTTNYKAATTLSAGLNVRSNADKIYEVPLGIALRATPRIELGAKLETNWGDVHDHAPLLICGVKWLTLKQTSIQADFLFGINNANGSQGNKGLAFSTYYKFQYASWLSSGLSGRLGFMEALVSEDALMAMEFGFYPALNFNSALTFEMGLITSSQSKNFENHLAMDLQPALRVGFDRVSWVETAIALGLAGNRKEDFRLMVSIIHGIGR